MNVSKRLTELREMKGLTVNKLANLAGLSQSFLRDIELEIKNPTVESLSLFCEALGITLHEFFNEEKSEINPFLKSSLEKLTDEQQIKLAEFLNSLNSLNSINKEKSS